MPLGIDAFAARPIQGRGVMLDIAHHLGRDKRTIGMAEIAAIIAGGQDHPCGKETSSACTPALPMSSSRWSARPIRERVHNICAALDGARPGAARLDLAKQDRGHRCGQLRGRADRARAWHAGDQVRAASPPLPVQARRAARRAVAPDRAGGLAAVARPHLVPADRTALAPAGRGRLAGNSGGDGVGEGRTNDHRQLDPAHDRRAGYRRDAEAGRNWADLRHGRLSAPAVLRGVPRARPSSRADQRRALRRLRSRRLRESDEPSGLRGRHAWTGRDQPRHRPRGKPQCRPSHDRDHGRRQSRARLEEHDAGDASARSAAAGRQGPDTRRGDQAHPGAHPPRLRRGDVRSSGAGAHRCAGRCCARRARFRRGGLLDRSGNHQMSRAPLPSGPNRPRTRRRIARQRREAAGARRRRRAHLPGLHGAARPRRAARHSRGPYDVGQRGDCLHACIVGGPVRPLRPHCQCHGGRERLPARRRLQAR